jgi:DNA-directed RNA polymerase specialized sigma24 family protein
VLEIDDNQLIKRVAQGDERAFLTLYDCYVGRVHALMLRILGNPMLAEEAAQDTFLKLWSRSREYQPERGLLLSWLLTIARRTALDRLWLEGRRPTPQSVTINVLQPGPLYSPPVRLQVGGRGCFQAWHDDTQRRICSSDL